MPPQQDSGNARVYLSIALLLALTYLAFFRTSSDVSPPSSDAGKPIEDGLYVVSSDEATDTLDALHSHHANLNDLESKVKQLKAEAEKKYKGKKIIMDVSRGQSIASHGEGILESSLPKGSRVLPPGSAATMDYRPDRLNLMTNDDFVVESVNYG